MQLRNDGVSSREPVVYVNREFVSQSSARISVLDHAVLYGDGIFETAVAREGMIFKLEAHIERGLRSMAAIALPPPCDRAEMRDLILETVRRNALKDAYIKWLVTRGSNGRPLMDPTGCVPNLIIMALPLVHRVSAERLADGLRMKTVAVRRPPGQVLDPQIKSINYLNLVMAKLEAKAAGADEALLLDLSGRVCEATGCNVFAVRGKRMLTSSHDILAGVTRETVMDLASGAGFSAAEADLELYDVYTADEVFLSSTAGGLLPVTLIDGRRIGTGNPGPAYRALAAAYERLLVSGAHSTPIPGLTARDRQRKTSQGDH
jgi:branched-chain amino acid aminotransferase